jgi:hypothetical protein
VRLDLFVCSFLRVGALRCVLQEAASVIEGAVGVLPRVADKTRFLPVQYALFRQFLPRGGSPGGARL